MNCRQAYKVINNPEKYSGKVTDAAVDKMWKMSEKMLLIGAIIESIGSMLVSLMKLTMWYGGSALAMVSFLLLTGNLTAEYDVAPTDIIRLELLLIIGLVSAYIGYKTMEKSEKKARNQRSTGKTQQ